MHIRSARFPVQEGEEQEIVNPRTYGRAFAEYLKESLRALGYDCPWVCCEDWGWWVEVRLSSVSLGLCCYREHDENTPCEFVCTPSLEKTRVWSWKRVGHIDVAEPLQRLMRDLEQVFKDDPDIEFLGVTDTFPL